MTQTQTSPIQDETPVVDPVNFNLTVRDGFDIWPSTNWNFTTASGDIIRSDGNAAAASYLVISKDPLTQGSVSNLTSTFTAQMPIEVAWGAHMSQRTVGQEFSLEIVSNDAPITGFTDLAIASVSQTTTILTVNTTLPHGLAPGNCIAIYGCTDPRMNFPAIVVASIPTPTSFTVTAGPMGVITSLTAGPFTSGFVTLRGRLGGAQSGLSQIFENALATQASIYVRANAGDVLPSGTIIAAHVVTVGTTASIQAVNAAYAYTFQPTTEYRYVMAADRVQVYDTVLDTTAQATSRQARTQVIPDNTKTYFARVRASNSKSLTVPVGRIITAAKAGSTTATITTDAPHGLTTSDWVIVYGIADQTNFANLTVATVVASVIDALNFTVVIATSATATSHGGFVARVNGANLGSALGYSAVVATAAVVSTAADGTQILTLTGNTNWASLLIGDYVNVHGLINLSGVSLACDGPYQIRNVSTTSLELGPIGATVLPANFGSVACGGGVIKRTDLRLSFFRLFDFDRMRVELLARPTGDSAAAAPVNVQNALTVTNNAAAAPTVQIGQTIQSYSASATAGPTLLISKLIAAASTNSTLIKTGATRLVGGVVTNTSATIKYIKFYNKATAPTVGTDVPVLTLGIPALTTLPITDMLTGAGLQFALGAGFGLTGAAADTDTTVLVAGDVVVGLLYI